MRGDRRSATKVMGFRFRISRLLALGFLLAPGLAPCVAAQDDAPAAPLGDIARNLRQKKSQQAAEQQSQSTVIDNDNLSQVMEDAKKARPVKADKAVFSIDSANNTLKLSAPDVTCSLSFNSRTSALLIRPILIEDLPLAELLKHGLGPARNHHWPDARTQARR
jgi:hypothetical protein